MTPNQLNAWFDEIAAKVPIRNEKLSQSKLRAEDDGSLLSEMHSALDAAFPPSHTLRRRWEDARLRISKDPHYGKRPVPEAGIFQEFEGIFASALSQVKQGRVASLAEGVRAETVAECLDVADTLVAAKHAVAAMVVAGGALEVHLRHLCVRAGLALPEPGSIEKYNQALAQARNNGIETISSTDTKEVSSYGSCRNDAAHGPTTFTRSADEVRLMVQGIRQFVARTQ